VLAIAFALWWAAPNAGGQDRESGSAATIGVETDSAAGGAIRCLPNGDGYVRARISGALNEELRWENEGTECSGAVRPTDGGVRMRFSRRDAHGGRLVLLFGVAGLREGQSAELLPVNVTVMREGAGEFYSTQGDDKCMLEGVRQTPLLGAPHRFRSYRIAARGFCTEPARAVHGAGAVLLPRFDIAGRVDYGDEDDEDARQTMVAFLK
jgi:hypothetical protein